MAPCLVLPFSPVMKREICLLLFVIVSFGAITIAAGEDQSTNFTVRTLALPDHGKGKTTMDYIAYDPATEFVWVPAINIGTVYSARMTQPSLFGTK